MSRGQSRLHAQIESLADKSRWSLNGGPFGSKLVSSMYVDEGVPVIRGANMGDGSRFKDSDFVFVTTEKADELRAHTAKRGDVVFTQRGTLGQVALIPQSSRFDRYVISQSQMKLTVDPIKANAAFVYYCFCDPNIRSDFIALASSSGVPHVNLATLREFSIPIPPLPVQRRIADILTAYDDLIESNTRRIAILEDMARRLFEEWFNRPALEVLPDGWALQPLRNFLKLHYGKALKADTRVEGLVPVYGSSGVVGSHNVALVSGPGIILGRKGNVGSVFYSPCDFYPIDTVFYVETGLPLHFIYQLLRHQTFSNSDSAVPGLNRELALAKEVSLPPTDLANRYDAWVGPVMEQAQSLRNANTNLRTTRDLLLPKLISGEVEVRAAEEALEAVAA